MLFYPHILIGDTQVSVLPNFRVTRDSILRSVETRRKTVWDFSGASSLASQARLSKFLDRSSWFLFNIVFQCWDFSAHYLSATLRVAFISQIDVIFEALLPFLKYGELLHLKHLRFNKCPFHSVYRSEFLTWSRLFFFRHRHVMFISTKSSFFLDSKSFLYLLFLKSHTI